jgi:putative transposase
VLIAHKIALEPSNKQATYFAKAAGTARFAYNWALSEWQRQYEAWQIDKSLAKPTEQALRRQLNAIKRDQFPWMLEVTKNAPQMAIIQLGQAFKNFFAGRCGYPQFRKRGVHDRFSLTNDQFSIDGRRIRIPHLGWVRLRESLRFAGKLISATISRIADRWFVSVNVETADLTHLPKAESQGVVGVDLGISSFATLSTGEPPVAGPKAHTALLMRLRRLSRSLSKKQKGSANRMRAKNKLARIHAKIANIRLDAIHKLTDDLTHRFRIVAIEDLNVKGMMRNRCLARSIADMGFHEFRRQLNYKAQMRGCAVVVADRWFASSKICSSCGQKLNTLSLSVRQWTCPSCGVRHDRDVNAAINLKKYAVSSTVSACGGEGSGSILADGAKPTPVKQEASVITTFG